MDLGKFSVSLAVKDLQASRTFYQKFGFKVHPATEFDDEEITKTYDKTWVILTNGSEVIGLFQGMFPKNTLTWNPTDVRGVQKQLKEQGIEFQTEADETTTGPASATLVDPDGNPVLLDQHND